MSREPIFLVMLVYSFHLIFFFIYISLVFSSTQKISVDIRFFLFLELFLMGGDSGGETKGDSSSLFFFFE